MAGGMLQIPSLASPGPVRKQPKPVLLLPLHSTLIQRVDGSNFPLRL